MAHALKITALEKTYENGFQALKGIDLTVQIGDFFALLGPNGAGKSTIIGIITSLIQKSAGEVEVFNYNLQNEASKAKAKIGLVPQEFNFNVFEPVEEVLINQAGYYGIPKSDAKKRCQYFLQQLGLGDKHKEIIRNLSGGMKRRVMIARALIHKPELLILDEPTACVDIETRHTMWQFLRKINQEGTTIILTTHYLEEAEDLCRHIAIIDEGYLVENTSMKHLLEQIDSEIFVLDLKTALQHPPELPHYTFNLTSPNTLEVRVATNRDLSQLFCGLAENNIEVSSLRNKSNRLEQLFLNRLHKNQS